VAHATGIGYVGPPGLKCATSKLARLREECYPEDPGVTFLLIDPSDATDRTDPSDLIMNCPQCGKAMALRTAKQGQNAGQQFWGCTGYPDCKRTVRGCQFCVSQHRPLLPVLSPTPLTICSRQNQRIAPSTGLSATFSPFQGRRDFEKATENTMTNPLTALPSPLARGEEDAVKFFSNGP